MLPSVTVADPVPRRTEFPPGCSLRGWIAAREAGQYLQSHSYWQKLQQIKAQPRAKDKTTVTCLPSTESNKLGVVVMSEIPAFESQECLRLK